MPLPGIEAINGRLGYSDYTHDEVVEDEGVLATFDNQEWEGRLEAVHSGFGPVETGAVGIQWSHRDFEALGEAAEFLLPTETRSFGGYVFERVALSESFALEGAARLESTRIKGETEALGAFDRAFTPFSIAAGAVFRPMESLSLSLNLSQTERAPNAVELYAQGPHEASATFEIGDPGIGKERAGSIEVGVHYDGADNTHATFGVFSSSFDGFIAGVLTGNSYDEDGNFFPDDSGEFAELVYVRRDAHFWGFEADAHLPLFMMGRGFAGVDLNADYVRADFDSGGNLPRIPPLRYGGGLFYEDDAMRVAFGILHTARQDDVAANESPTNGFTMVDATGTFRIYDGDSGALNLSLAAFNILDETARNHVSFTKDHVLLPGRNFRLMLDFVY
jgi:iron complex outermembrane receptor protein